MPNSMKKMTRGMVIAGLFAVVGACSSASPPSRSSGMCQFATDAGVVYSCSTLTNLTSSGLTANCAAPGQFTADQTCPTVNAVATCTIKLPANGASIVAYYYPPNTCDAAKTSCNATMSSGSTITFSGNGC
jgi:hypothetical protein